jgi:hypothetical protein
LIYQPILTVAELANEEKLTHWLFTNHSSQ